MSRREQTSERCGRSGEHQAAATAFVAVAEEAFRYGRREQQATSLSGVAASLAALGQGEPAAVILGWVESILGSLEAMLSLNPGSEAGAVAARLTEDLGDDRYASLHTQGAAMTAEEILQYAHKHATPTTASTQR